MLFQNPQLHFPMPEAYRLPHPNVDDAILFAVVLPLLFFVRLRALPV